MEWFTSDTHFGHTNVIKYDNRPFRDTHHMNESLIDNWNSVVKPNDTVYHLGDVYLCAPGLGNNILYRLNGKIHLVLGNHDKLSRLPKDRFESIQLAKLEKINGKWVWMCHYANKVWYKSHHGSYHLYGHSHGTLFDDPYSRSFDVGVCNHNYFPISWDKVVEIMDKKQFKSIDHHGEKTN